MTETKKELTLLNGNFGTWNYKHKFLQKKFAEKALFIHFVRDPRSWINAIMWQNKLEPEDRNSVIGLLIDNYLESFNDKYSNLEHNSGLSIIIKPEVVPDVGL